MKDRLRCYSAYSVGLHTNSMAFILDGNSETGAYERSNLRNLICLRHLISSRVVTNSILFFEEDPFSFMRAQHVLSYQLMLVYHALAGRLQL